MFCLPMLSKDSRSVTSYTNTTASHPLRINQSNTFDSLCTWINEWFLLISSSIAYHSYYFINYIYEHKKVIHFWLRKKPFFLLLKKSSGNPYLKICDFTQHFLWMPLWKNLVLLPLTALLGHQVQNIFML